MVPIYWWYGYTITGVELGPPLLWFSKFIAGRSNGADHTDISHAESRCLGQPPQGSIICVLSWMIWRSSRKFAGRSASIFRAAISGAGMPSVRWRWWCWKSRMRSWFFSLCLKSSAITGIFRPPQLPVSRSPNISIQSSGCFPGRYFSPPILYAISSFSWPGGPGAMRAMFRCGWV